MSRRIASYWLTGLAWLHCVCGTVTNLGVGFAAEYGTPALSAETPAKHEVQTQQTYGEASSSTIQDVFTVLERETMLSHKVTCIGADGYSLQSPQLCLPTHDDFFPSFFRDDFACNRATSEDAIALLGY